VFDLDGKGKFIFKQNIISLMIKEIMFLAATLDGEQEEILFAERWQQRTFSLITTLMCTLQRM